MLNVFIDTNILLDYVLDRQPWSEAAARLMLASNEKLKMKGYISPHSLSNVFYVVSKTHNSSMAHKAIDLILETCEVAPLDKEACLAANEGAETDFEDGLIEAATRLCRADVIVTRDSDAFNRSDLIKVDLMTFDQFFLADNPYPNKDCELWAAEKL